PNTSSWAGMQGASLRCPLCAFLKSQTGIRVERATSSASGHRTGCKGPRAVRLGTAE
ncbi:hypothetical protein NDU88_011682, partial [Pleurodeles waltl]